MKRTSIWGVTGHVGIEAALVELTETPQDNDFVPLLQVVQADCASVWVLLVLFDKSVYCVFNNFPFLLLPRFLCWIRDIHLGLWREFLYIIVCMISKLWRTELKRNDVIVVVIVLTVVTIPIVIVFISGIVLSRIFVSIWVQKVAVGVYINQVFLANVKVFVRFLDVIQKLVLSPAEFL